jgi:SWIM/SEC-C metal-binding protein
MARLGTHENPVVVHVRSMERVQEIASICNEHGWKFIAGIEPDKPEDISDVERLLHPPAPARTQVSVGRNDPCPCGSGRKYKKCCGR